MLNFRRHAARFSHLIFSAFRRAGSAWFEWTFSFQFWNYVHFYIFSNNCRAVCHSCFIPFPIFEILFSRISKKIGENKEKAKWRNRIGTGFFFWFNCRSDAWFWSNWGWKRWFRTIFVRHFIGYFSLQWATERCIFIPIYQLGSRVKLLLRKELENKKNWVGNNKDQKTAEIIQQKLVNMVATLDKIEAKHKKRLAKEVRPKESDKEVVSLKVWSSGLIEKFRICWSRLDPLTRLMRIWRRQCRLWTMVESRDRNRRHRVRFQIW